MSVAPSLNVNQKAAVFLDAKKILCLAGAGTGKTFCMIERIVRLIEDGVDPSSILVLTFTNAAAFEMEERYKRRMTSSAVPNFRTFHAFCYSLLSTDYSVRKAMGYAEIPDVADDDSMKALLRKASMQVGIKLTADMEDPRRNNRLSPKQMQEMQILKKAQKRLMIKDNLITFDSLCYGVCELFRNGEPCTSKYLQRYKYIFVDEFQDTDPRQWDFVQSFKDANLFVVGDALQAIYGFRHADSSIIKGLSTDAEWTTVRLEENYRSTSQICQFANDMSVYADDNYRVQIRSERQSEQLVEMSTAHPGFMGRISQERIRDCYDAHLKFGGKSAILARTNSEVEQISDILSRKGIPYTTSRIDSDALEVLRSVLSNDYLLNWCASSLNLVYYSRYLREKTIAETQGLEYTLENFMASFQYYSTVQARATKVKKIRKVLSENLQLQEYVSEISEILRMPLISDNVDFSSPRKIVQSLIEQMESTKEEDLYVGTIHSSKGLEYDNVFLISVGGKSFALRSEEDMNLYYVGITRAKNYLRIYNDEENKDEREFEPNTAAS